MDKNIDTIRFLFSYLVMVKTRLTAFLTCDFDRNSSLPIAQVAHGNTGTFQFLCVHLQVKRVKRQYNKIQLHMDAYAYVYVYIYNESVEGVL